MRTKNKKEIKEWQNVILDNIADGVFTVDLNWKITSFNKAAEKITGISCSQICSVIRCRHQVYSLYLQQYV